MNDTCAGTVNQPNFYQAKNTLMMILLNAVHVERTWSSSTHQNLKNQVSHHSMMNLKRILKNNLIKFHRF